VPALHVVLVALATNTPPAEVAARLAAAGFEVAGTLPDQLTPLDDKITRRRYRPSSGLHPTAVVSPGHVVSVALEVAEPPAAVARRMAELGISTPSPGFFPQDADTTDLPLLSASIEVENGLYASEPTWLRTGQSLSFQHVLIAAAKSSRSPRSIARRLAEFGFGTPPDHVLDFDVRLEDLLLLSANLNGKPPWLTNEHLVVPLGHVLAAAALLARPPAEVAARLSELGLRTEDVPLPEKVERYDGKLLARVRQDDRFGEFCWIGAATPVDALHLLVSAADVGMAPQEVAGRLSELGFPVADSRDLPLSVDRIDLVLLSRGLDGRYPYRDLGAEFPREDVMRSVAPTRLLPHEVFERLARLGITVGE
jgi:precorrin-6B methylase 1